MAERWRAARDYSPSEAEQMRARLLRLVAARVAGEGPEAGVRLRGVLAGLRQEWSAPPQLRKAHPPVTVVGEARALAKAIEAALPGLRGELGPLLERAAVMEYLRSAGQK
jgi:hypothetical protein